MKYIRKSNRGNLKAGSTLVDQFNVAGYEGKNYTSEIVEGEAHSLAEGQTEFHLDYAPIRPNTVTGLPAGATVDYATGRVTLATPAVAGDIEVSYVQDLEYAPAQVPEIGIELRDTFVTARPRKLKSLFSLDAAYDLQMSQGVDLANTMLVAAANEFRHETDGDIIMDLYNRAGLTSTWADDFVVGSGDMGVSRRQQAQTFADEIHIAATNIFQVTKRVVGNYVVVGKKGMDLLTIIGAPRFVAAGSITAGPHFAGTLDGNIKVYYSPFLPQNNYLVGYKGDSLVDAGYVYAPYMMFYATELLMMDDFVGRRGYATSYGKRMLEPNLYVKGTITGKAAYTN